MRAFTTRRTFLARSATASATIVSYPASWARAADAKSDRLNFGVIGAGWQSGTRRAGRGIALIKAARPLADISMVCEVDSEAGEFAVNRLNPSPVQLVKDYRQVLDRKEIDAVLIATPDHWHSKIAIEAMLAGKDVYLEKPATVTVAEGQQLIQAKKKTGRVLQVGTQQRSEYNQRFIQAAAMVRAGRIGKLKRIQIGLDPGNRGGPFPVADVPARLDWDRWLGPAPMTAYRPERTHRTFRWWFEYAGGQLADWGAHHMDIVQWALGQDHTGPAWVKGTCELNQPLVDGMPTRIDMYNTPISFEVMCGFEASRGPVATTDDELIVTINSGRNGITFEGEAGRFFVNRGTLEGTPVEQLKQHPLSDAEIKPLVGQHRPGNHMQDFVDCLRSGQQPIANIESHHRTISTCHLANLSLRLGRSLQWDADAESFVGDDQANSLLSRSPRQGYETESME